MSFFPFHLWLNVKGRCSHVWHLEIRDIPSHYYTSVSYCSAIRKMASFFHYFLTPLCSMEHLFLWIDIQSRKGKRSYKLHSQDTKTSSKPYKLHGEIATAIPNQALQRHRGEQLAGELERCGVVMSLRLGRMNFTSLVPLHSHCIQPQLLWLHESAGDWISPRESEIQINILLKN